MCVQPIGLYFASCAVGHMLLSNQPATAQFAYEAAAIDLSTEDRVSDLGPQCCLDPGLLQVANASEYTSGM